jgi:hypothetical protein
VNVKVDQTGCDTTAVNVENLFGIFPRQLRAERRDPLAGDAQV